MYNYLSINMNEWQRLKVIIIIKLKINYNHKIKRKNLPADKKVAVDENKLSTNYAYFSDKIWI